MPVLPVLDLPLKFKEEDIGSPYSCSISSPMVADIDVHLREDAKYGRSHD